MVRKRGETPISLSEEILILQDIANRARERLIKVAQEYPNIHLGSSLSSIEILTVLMFKFAKKRHLDPINRDWIILSKGHAAPAYYSLLVEKGVISEEELFTIQDVHSRLQGHPEISIPEVDMSTGSLGQGLSFAIGVATGIKMLNGKGRVYVVMGDGEHDEGEVWEAITHAPVRKLDNLTAIVDMNGFQLDGKTEDIKPKEELLPKVYEAAGWRVLKIDGHDILSLVLALEESQKSKSPSVIFAKTVRGKGVLKIENTEIQKLL